VVVLRIVLEDFCSLIVLESADELFDADTRIFFPPFLAVDKPELGQFPSSRLLYSMQTYICFASSTLNLRARRNRSCKLLVGYHFIGVCGPQEAYQGQSIQVMSMSCFLEDGPQLKDLGILLGCGVAGVAILRCRGRGGEFVVVVLGVELQLVWTGGSHD